MPWFWSPQWGLERIHDVAVAAIEGEVVPTPIGDGANAIATTHQVEEVQEEPSKPGNRSADLQFLNLNDRLMATNGGH